MKKLVIGILAHVDAGKTTLSEGLLYQCGQIRKPGRVDHGDAFLDTYAMEKERGITIFSKQAVLRTEEIQITLLDTPGHVDFSSEMERTLQVLDYAILVISGADGIQGHTLTLWTLLQRYGIPVFLFVNKMDQPDTDRTALMEQLCSRFSRDCVDFTPFDMFPRIPETIRAEAEQEELLACLEGIAACDEELLEQYLENETIRRDEIAALIAKRQLFPCFFGSALRMTGVKEFLESLQLLTFEPLISRQQDFGARVFKINRDEGGSRLTFMRILSGTLRVKTLLEGISAGQEWEEKADQLRIYSGARYETVQEAGPGEVVAVTGLTHTLPGDGLGHTPSVPLPVLEPVLDYRLLLPRDCDVHRMLRQLKELEEEDPQLHIHWEEQTEEIHVMLMGEVQTQILKSVILDRFHVSADFDAGNVVYRETIAAPVIGVGHFEPLRHYAEVHLLMEPGEPGSGLELAADCSEDVLDRNWQRLILTHLAEREHPGVLTGAPVTDMRITLINGRSHLKHTEGGDFRQATYRAIRQGLRKAPCVLLEPWYDFRMELPPELAGRAMTDIRRMDGEMKPPETEGDEMILTGRAPVSALREYPRELAAYSSGRGRIFCVPGGYAPCKRQEEILAETGYDPEADTENPTGSVFCAHGVGFIVPWDQVEEYMHLQDDPRWIRRMIPGEESDGSGGGGFDAGMGSRTGGGFSAAGMKGESSTFGQGETGGWYGSRESYAGEQELKEIFERTYGPVKTRLPRQEETSRTIQAAAETGETAAPALLSQRKQARRSRNGEDYLLVDGYNIIFAWKDLSELAKTDIHAAQSRLMDVLSNYQGLCGCRLILVFDAYKVQGHREEIQRFHNIYVVYTKEAETADMYIEKTVHRLVRNNRVTVATSDGLEQVIILGQGANRISARELRQEIDEAMDRIRTELGAGTASRSVLIDRVDPEAAAWMEQRRLQTDGKI